MRKDLRAYIEAELRDYHRTIGEMDELRNNLLGLSPTMADGLPHGGETSDPTGRGAIRLTTNRRLNYMARVVDGIKSVIAELPEEKMELVRLKYWEHPRQLTDAGIAIQLHISKSTLYYWVEEILTAIAVQLGLMAEAQIKIGKRLDF